MFIPRKVSRPNDVTRRLTVTRPEFVQESAILQEDLKGKGKTADASSPASEELAALVHLGLSKYCAWINPDLTSSDDGYISLVHLISRSDGFTDMEAMPPEIDVARAVQKHLSNALEVRILVSSPQMSVWQSGSRSDPTGGYEIRRKDWQSVRSATAPLRKQDWDVKTVYLEKLPPRVRSVAAIYRFVWSMLNSRRSCTFDVIQDVKLVPSNVETEPKRSFRGFAFVTLSSSDLVKQLVDDWPWLPPNRSVPESDVIPASVSGDVADAQKCGLRAVTKARWEELRDEYLAYRAQLLHAVHEEEQRFGTNFRPNRSTMESDTPPPVINGPFDSASPRDYPVGCLIYARNIHTETNKTTLRKLFRSPAGASQDIIDYVDFNKGMDSCFLRIRSPREASALIDHFRTNPLMQSGGLDADGVPPSGRMKPIVMELVEGKKEELYWEKVPENTRRQAVQNALQLSGVAETRSPPSKRRRKG